MSSAFAVELGVLVKAKLSVAAIAAATTNPIFTLKRDILCYEVNITF